MFILYTYRIFISPHKLNLYVSDSGYVFGIYFHVSFTYRIAMAISGFQILILMEGQNSIIARNFYSNPPPLTGSWSEITTGSQSASPSWCQAPIWDQQLIFFLLDIFFRQLRVCYFVAPSLTRGRVCNLLSLFTSDSKSNLYVLRPTVCLPVRPGITHPSETREQFVKFCLYSCGFVDVGRPLWREDRSVICSEMTQVQFQVILQPTVCRPVRFGAGPPMGPITRFYFLCLIITFFLFGVGFSYPYPPWTGWSSPKSESKAKVTLV
jgi:hypothetical protein